MKTGIELITEERRRQIEKEGWTDEHDAEHINGEIALAGAIYAIPPKKRFTEITSLWPWDIKWFKPTPDDRVRELVKAGALIVAEIDRLQNNKNK